MKFFNKWVLALVPGLAVATPALALLPAGLADLTQPGSVLIYPKFVANDVNIPNANGAPGVGGVVPQTEIEIGVVCPRFAPPNYAPCAQHQTVFVKFHWVCGAVEDVDSQICHETDFTIPLSINGKLAFNASGTPINSNSPPITPPPVGCKRGYLIAWVVDAFGNPIRFDGLIGNAIIRGGNLAVGGNSTAVSAYTALGIQAADTTVLPNPPPPIALVGGTLPFTGLPGQYTTVSSVNYGDVRFDRTTPGLGVLNGATEVLSQTALVFLTLDVISGRHNDPTWVDLLFYNESLNTVSTTNPFWERQASDTFEFICFAQVPLSNLAGGVLTQVLMNSRKGLFIAHATDDVFADRTLLSLVETIEGTVPNALMERKYNYITNNGPTPVPVATRTMRSALLWISC